MYGPAILILELSLSCQKILKTLNIKQVIYSFYLFPFIYLFFFEKAARQTQL